MSTNDPGLNRTLTEIKETLRKMGEITSGLQRDVVTLNDTDKHHTGQINDLRERVSVLESDDLSHPPAD